MANNATITARLCEIQQELVRISGAVCEANKPLGISFNGRPNPGGVERAHQELFDIQTRIVRAANQIDRLRAQIQTTEKSA